MTSLVFFSCFVRFSGFGGFRDEGSGESGSANGSKDPDVEGGAEEPVLTEDLACFSAIRRPKW